MRWTRWLWLVLVPAVAFGGRGKRARTEAPAYVLVDPTDRAEPTPYASQVLRPPLDGATSTLDIAALSRQSLEFTIATDTSALVRVVPGNEAAIARHVAADPRWRLVEEDGAVVAFRRVKDGDAWTVPLGGYHAGDDGVWRAALRFTPWDPASPWVTSKLVGRADAKATTTKVTAYNVQLGPTEPWWKGVALAWNAPELSFEAYEAGTSEDLPHTVEMLGIVPGYVDGLVEDLDMIAARGFDPYSLPAKEPLPGEPSVAVLAPAAAELDVRARVHPPGPGFTWIRILDGDSRPWEEPAVAAGTREILGWSEIPEEQFYLQGRFPVASGPAFSATVEVWHQPIASITDTTPRGAPIRLARFDARIPSRP